MKILGIDPGYGTIGWGIIDCTKGKLTFIDYGAITTPAGERFEDRLEQIYDDILKIIDNYKPDKVAFEELYFSKNITTGIKVAHARGVLVLAARQRGLEIFEYGPMQVKQAIVGYGRAEKRQMMEMVRFLLGLSAIPRPDDAADALAIAICNAHVMNY